MERNNGQTIFLSVIGIATLLVAIIGATFAYFSTSMTGNAADVTATSAKIGAVTYSAVGVTGNAILPGWSDSGSATVSLGESDNPVNYTCTLNVTVNGFGTTGSEQIKLQTSGTNANGTYTSAQPITTGEYQIASGQLTSNGSATTNYTLSFPETGADQNDYQNKTITGTVSCSIGGTVYYNTNNVNGTNTTPTAY